MTKTKTYRRVRNKHGVYLGEREDYNHMEWEALQKGGCYVEEQKVKVRR